MAEITSQSAGNPEFARVVEVARLRGLPEYAFDLVPTAAEAAALARLMDAREIPKLRFSGRLLPAARGAWQIEGQLGATVVQSCVVTLDPVTSRINVPVRLRFVPQIGPQPVDVAVAPLEDDEIEPLGDRIDLGLVAIEALALALPAYPRREGAKFGDGAVARPAGASRSEAEVKPFAALAALRDKLGSGS